MQSIIAPPEGIVSATHEIDDAHPADVTSNARIATFFAIILPLAGLVVAVWLLWGRGVSTVDLALFFALYAITAMGITIGYHRLLTHRAFETTRPVKFLLSVAGSMAVQGSVLHWVATHRRHHQHSDEEEDPHSPHAYGSGVIGVLRGLWHSHIGWLFQKDSPELAGYVRDLRRDSVVATVSRLFPLWVALGLFLPAIIGGLVTQSWFGVLTGFIWGGLVRVFVVHHVTWSINSVCHIWGSRPFRTGDHSRNNPIFGILAWGEGWHNNHHAFPTSARHGLRWWQIDISYLVIRTLNVFGLAWNLRLPAAEAMAARSTVQATDAPGVTSAENDCNTDSDAAARLQDGRSDSQLLRLIVPAPETC